MADESTTPFGALFGAAAGAPAGGGDAAGCAQAPNPRMRIDGTMILHDDTDIGFLPLASRARLISARLGKHNTRPETALDRSPLPRFTLMHIRVRLGACVIAMAASASAAAQTQLKVASPDARTEVLV